MVGTRRTRSGRSISREPTNQNPRLIPGADAVDQNASASIPNPQFANTPLPAVQTQHSFAYGASGTPVVARQLRFNGPTGTAQMAAVMQGNDFERITEEARANPDTGRVTRSRGASVPRLSASPTRSVRRRPTRARERTPDDQLMEGLREASEEAEEFNEVVLPSIEQSSVLASLTQSTVSFDAERLAILNRANPTPSDVGSNSFGGSAQSQRQGSVPNPFRSIAGPPLRPQNRSQRLQDSQAPGEIRPGPGSATTIRPMTSRLGPIPNLNPAQPEGQADFTPFSRGTPPSSSSASSAGHATATPAASSQQRSSTLGVTLMTILLMLLAMAGTLSQMDGLKGMLPEGLALPISFCSPRPATTEYAEAFNKLSAGVDQRLTVMSRDVTALKEEWNKRLPHLKQAIWPEKEDPLLPRRLNWFSIGLGALVDPYLTTKYHAGIAQHSSEQLTGTKRTNPPVAALTRWNEHGDCWCVRNYPNEIQLGVLLGRPLVPEEVVVEHIWKAATLDPESAPREMELWVEYAARVDDSSLSSSGAGSGPRQTSAASSPAHMKGSAVIESSAEARAIFSAPLSSAQRKDVTSTLRMVYPDEPETAYTSDNDLGATFYRVGKFQYDINDKQNIQKFQLDAVIDLPDVRVKRAVLRVKSNWGSVNTCLYRVRLHGHL